MSYKTTDKQSYLTDKDWVRSIFMINQEEIESIPENLRTWSSADVKFQDTALGGSLVINPLPQPCVFTDPVSSTHWLKTFNANNDGLSPYFSEAFDDNYRIVTFRFGTLAFTSLTGFLFNMYHPGAAAMINKGIIDKALFTIGRIVGKGVQLITWPLQLLGFLGKAATFVMRKPTSRYAYLKPNMPLYWSSVQTIVNHFITDLGLVFRRSDVLDDKDSEGNVIKNKDLTPTNEQVSAMRKMWPNIYGENGPMQNFLTGALGAMGFDDRRGQVDVFVVATRAQRLAHARYQALEEINDRTNAKLNVKDLFIQAYNDKGGRNIQTISEYLRNWTEQGGSMYSVNRWTPEGTNNKDEIGDAPKEKNIDNQGFFDFLKSELRDGGAYISFRVDDTGSVSETFSNSYRTSQLMEKINSTSSSSRSTFFDMAGGNIGDDIVSNTVESVVGGVKSLAEGLISGIGLEGLLVAGGGGTVSMPKYWESSEAQLPKPSYQFTLKARYANNMSRFQDIYFPLACILAACLPVSVGKHSHSNPLYFEFYDKGRMQSRLAAIDSLTITRGDGNMGFTPGGHLMSLNVSFGIVPMEEIIAMPITEGYRLEDTLTNMLGAGLVTGSAALGLLGGGLKSMIETTVRGIFDDDTPFMDYMATLAGLGVNEQYYLHSKLKRRLSFNQLQKSSMYSSARMAAFSADFMPVKIISALSVGSDYHNAFFYDERAQ